MATTYTRISGPHTQGSRFETVGTLLLDNSYPTGGYALSQATLGFAATADPTFDIRISNTNGYGGVYDYTNQKLLFYTSAGTQTSNATDLSAITVRVAATGKYRG